MLPWYRFIDKAIDFYDKPKSNYRHFSFIVYKNTILSTGFNNATKTHPLAFKFNYPWLFRHSELDSIAKFPEPISFLKKCSIVNIRLGKTKNLLMSRPCKNCLYVLKTFNLNKIYFSNEFNQFELL